MTSLVLPTLRALRTVRRFTSKMSSSTMMCSSHGWSVIGVKQFSGLVMPHHRQVKTSLCCCVSLWRLPFQARSSLIGHVTPAFQHIFRARLHHRLHWLLSYLDNLLQSRCCIEIGHLAVKCTFAAVLMNMSETHFSDNFPILVFYDSQSDCRHGAQYM